VANNTGSRVAVGINILIGKLLSILGYSIAILGILIIIVFVSDGDYADLHIFVFVLVIPGVIMIIQGARIKRRIRRFRRYVSFIAEGMTSLDILATQTSSTKDFVTRDIQKMINKRFFTNAAIDFINNQVMMLNIPTPINAHVHDHVAPTNYQQVFKTATCSGCGATSVKEQGAVISCEYCGSPIK